MWNKAENAIKMRKAGKCMLVGFDFDEWIDVIL